MMGVVNSSAAPVGHLTPYNLYPTHYTFTAGWAMTQHTYASMWTYTINRCFDGTSLMDEMTDY
jgi:hypothetical protein